MTFLDFVDYVISLLPHPDADETEAAIERLRKRGVFLMRIGDDGSKEYALNPEVRFQWPDFGKLLVNMDPVERYTVLSHVQAIAEVQADKAYEPDEAVTEVLGRQAVLARRAERRKRVGMSPRSRR